MPNPTTPIDEQVYLPIINGYVVVPDIAQNKRLTLTNALAAIPGSTFLTFVNQRFFMLPEFERTTGYPEDWFAILRASSSIL